MKILGAILLFIHLAQFDEPKWDLTLYAENPHDGPTLHLAQGKIQGVFLTNRKVQNKIAAYLGIPYAQPPINELRFHKPMKSRSWSGTLDATRFKPKCLQYLQFTNEVGELVEGDEDCLYLNVFVPLEGNHTAPTNKLDVVVYLHGDSFMWGGSTDYLPTLMTRKNVIFVTLNFRLNIFGFLSTEDDVIPGNFGLKDQVLALRWIKDNIAKFGGNVKSTTIMGCFAGGSSVHYHYLSNSSKGLFSKGISMSGTATSPWALSKKAASKAKQLAVLLSCPPEPSSQMLSCLRKVEARDFVANINPPFLGWMYNPFNPFGPVIENPDVDAFITSPPAYLLLDGTIQDLPWMVGVTTEEGLFPCARYLSQDQLLEEMELNWDTVVLHLLDMNYTLTPENRDEAVKRVKKYYFRGAQLGKHTSKSIIDMVSDRHFLVEAMRSAQLQANANYDPVYFYQYGYRGKHSYSDYVSEIPGGKTNWGVSHADDALSVVPKKPFNPSESWTDSAMSDMMFNMYLSFAHSGKPNFTTVNVNWIPVKPGNNSVLFIGGVDEVYMKRPNNFGNQEFWDSMPIQESHARVRPVPKYKTYPVERDEL